MESSSLDRFNKRKKLRNTITVISNEIDDNLVDEFLHSKCDNEKVNSVYLKTEEFYNITVTKEEAKEFLEKFKKRF